MIQTRAYRIIEHDYEAAQLISLQSIPIQTVSARVSMSESKHKVAGPRRAGGTLCS